MSEPEESQFEVTVVGDLHGRRSAFEGNLASCGVFSEGRYKLSGQRVIFLGDVVGDRGRDSLWLTREINRLRAAAMSLPKKGEIVTLLGNHEDYVLSYLRPDRDHQLTPSQRHTTGLLDLMKLHPEKDAYFGDLAELNQLNPDQWAEFIAKLSNYEDCGRKILDSDLSSELRQYFLASRLMAEDDGSLFFHTPPTEGMLTQWLDRSTEGVNRDFQKNLEKFLNGGDYDQDFISQRKIFLNTDTRFKSSPPSVPDSDGPIWTQLAERGISRIFCGHDKSPFDSKIEPLIYGIKGEVEIYPVDRRFQMHETDYGLTSVARIQQGNVKWDFEWNPA